MRVYLDHSATTPVRREALEAMLPFFTEKFGNASSYHLFGQEAKEALEDSRARIAEIIGATPEEIYFTGCGTESDNLAIKGVALALKDKGNHIITQVTEHEAVLEACKFLESQGFEVTYLSVDSRGMVDPDDVRKAITDKTVLVSIMYANNEIGTVQPVREIGKICRERGVLLHTDAVQAVGKVKINVEEDAVDLLSASAHKFYGPKGVGFLYARKGIKLVPVLHGGGHERGLRSGTENVAGVVGMAVALEHTLRDYSEKRDYLEGLRAQIIKALEEEGLDFRVNGHPERRIPGHLSLSFRGIDGLSLTLYLSEMGIAVSPASACFSHHEEMGMSHVVKATGAPEEYVRGTIRVVIGYENTEEEIKYFTERLIEGVKRLLKLSGRGGGSSGHKAYPEVS